MKKLYSLIVVISISLNCSAQTLNWTSEITVANGSTYGSERPRIAVGANNVPVVVWGGGTGSEPLYASRWNGTAFGTPVTVTPNGVDPAVMSWQGHEIASRGNIVYAVFKTQPEMMGRIYIVKSTDGGQTWSDTVAVDNMVAPYDRFPSVAVTSAGNPAVMMMTFDTSWMAAEYKVTNSTDGGQTFPMPVAASINSGSDVCDCCPGYIVTDGSNQACAYRRNASNIRDMWTSVSTNNGATFPTAIDCDVTNWMLMNCPSSGPSPFLNGDSLTTVFMSGASGTDRIYLSTRSISTGQPGYSVMFTSIAPSDDQNYPMMAGNGDTLVVVWQQSNGSQIDTYYSWSLTGAAGLLTNATILNSTTAGNQLRPHVAYSNGMFHFTWIDQSSGNVKYRSATILPNSIETFSAAHMLKACPNPSCENITIDLTAFGSDEVTVTVTDASCRVVERFVSRGNNSALISKQTSGVYMIEARSESAYQRSRIVFTR
jgi:hypothetical protein